jgi:hypothetical protein
MSNMAFISSGPPNVGTWTIETGVPGAGSPRDFDALVREAVSAFLTSFHGLAEVQDVSADLTWSDREGRVSRVEEVAPIDIDETGNLIVPTDVGLVTALFVDCRFWCLASTGMVAHDDGLKFRYGCVLDYDKEDRFQPVDSSVSVSLAVDCASGSEGGENRARLERALREWEHRTGRPITEWESSVYRRRVGRYGFEEPVVRGR